MADNPQNMRIAAVANIYAADVGTTLPVDINEALDPAFLAGHIGLCTEKGFDLSWKRTTKDYRSVGHQQPTLTRTTGYDGMLAFEPQEIKRKNLDVAFGGGDSVETDAGYRFDPPSFADDDHEWSVVLETLDSGKKFRWVIERVVNVKGLETTINSEDIELLPVEFKFLAPSDGSATPGMYILHNDAALHAVESGSGSGS